MAAWVCSCSWRNRAQAERCAKCDTERPFEPGAKDPVKHELPTCAWETDGHRCLMLATVWIGLTPHRDAHGEPSRPGYCSWHVMCLDSPVLADDFDEFDRWILAMLATGYCTEFLHHPATYVWYTVRGHWRADVDRLRVRPCGSSRCWVPELVELKPSRRVPPAEARSWIRRILDALIAKVAA